MSTFSFFFQPPVHNCGTPEKNKGEKTKWRLGRSQRSPTLHELYYVRKHTQMKLLAFLVERGNTTRKYHPKYAIHEILAPISLE